MREEGEAATRCTGGLLCEAQLVERIRHFVARGALDIEGLGEKQILAFWNDGLIKNITDIFALSGKAEEIQKREGWGKKSLDNLLKAIETARNVSLENSFMPLVSAMLARLTAKLLAREFGSASKWFAAMKELTVNPEINEQVQNINGIGGIVAGSLSDFFGEQHNVEIVEKLLAELNITDAKVANSNSQVSGKTVVFTEH